jgi:RNA polymerase sigma factor (sigma-70 family)
VFLRVAQRLNQFRFDAALATWIGQIAFSIGARHLRRKRLPMLEVVSMDDTDDQLAQLDAGVDLESEFSDAQQRQLVGAALSTLPPLQRTLITLYHVDHIGIPEIATITGIAQGTIKSHLFRTRKLLRDRLMAPKGD